MEKPFVFSDIDAAGKDASVWVGQGAEDSSSLLEPPAQLPSFKELELFPLSLLPHLPAVPQHTFASQLSSSSHGSPMAGCSIPSQKALTEQGSLIIWVFFQKGMNLSLPRIYKLLPDFISCFQFACDGVFCTGGTMSAAPSCLTTDTVNELPLLSVASNPGCFL